MTAVRPGAARLAGLAAVGLAAAVVAAGSAGGASLRSADEPYLQPVIGNDNPAWSPDGSLIAFTSFRNGRGDVYVIRPNGTGERRLTTHPAHDDHAAWSPDGRRIAFTSSRDGNPEIYVMNADGTGQRRLTRNPAREHWPTWSPDGSRIAFASDRHGRAQIFVINADGTGETRITSTPFSDVYPAWSPAGPIAFSSNREVSWKVWLVEPDGSNLRRATSSPPHVVELEPSWSPDGRRLALSAVGGHLPYGNAELYVYDADGGEPQRVTDYWGRDFQPTWSPDGRLAFARGPSAYRPEVWVMNADGRGLRQLTSTAVRFDVVRTIRAPARPAAGRRFALTALVTEPTGDMVERGTIACRATVGRRVLRPSLQRFSRSVAECAWQIPANARGQNVQVGFQVRSGRSGANHSVRLLVR